MCFIYLIIIYLICTHISSNGSIFIINGHPIHTNALPISNKLILFIINGKLIKYNSITQCLPQSIPIDRIEIHHDRYNHHVSIHTQQINKIMEYHQHQNYMDHKLFYLYIFILPHINNRNHYYTHSASVMNTMEMDMDIDYNNSNRCESIKKTIQSHRKSLKQQRKSSISNKKSNTNSNHHSAQFIPPPNVPTNNNPNADKALHRMTYNNADKALHRMTYNNASNSTTDEAEEDELSLHKNKPSLTSFPYLQTLKNIASNPSNVITASVSNSHMNNNDNITPHEAQLFSFMSSYDEHKNECSISYNIGNHLHYINKVRR